MTRSAHEPPRRYAARFLQPLAQIPRAIPLSTPEGPRRWLPSLIWLVPVLVVLVGLAVAVRTMKGRGPTVTITFATAEGLEANKTTIRYKSVVVGLIKRIELLEDRSGVVVTADLSPQMAEMLVDDARFWVVRPRVSAAGVSGMGTLLAGAHVAFDAGVSSTPRSDFVGLEAAPLTISDRRGRRFTLRADNLGSLDVGSPLYLRRFQVGQVTSVALAPGGHTAVLEIFVDAPHDAHVTSDTRFWNASGVDITMTTRGIKLDTQSLAAVLAGGIALETPPWDSDWGASAPVTPAAAGTTFEVFPDRETAMRAPASGATTYLLAFKHPPRGLTPGAAVELLGMEVGAVLRVDGDIDPATAEARTVVTIHLHPERIHLRSDLRMPDLRLPAAPAGVIPEPSPSASPSPPSPRALQELLRRLCTRGLRGQIRTANVVTTERYVTLDMAPPARSAPAAAIDWERKPVTLPTWEGPGDDLAGSLAALVAKLDKKLDQLPVEQLAREGILAMRQMRHTFEETSSLLTRVDAELLPGMTALTGQTEKTLRSVERTLASDAPLQRELRGALRDVSGAGHALRSLAEYLERHPESLIRGKKEDTR